MNLTSRILLLLTTLLPVHLIYGQTDGAEIDFGDFGGIIYLDSLVVTASRLGFDVADFVKIVQEDESFYRAFRNLRFHSYKSDNDIEMFGKKGDSRAHFQNRIHQRAEGLCRSMEVETEKVTGDFYKKNRDYRYYTAKLYDRLFFTDKKTCESSFEGREAESTKGMAKHIQELKKLIFQPGSKADIPLIGQKTAIFDPDMMAYYDFSIQSKTYSNGQDCYVFTAKVKEAYLQKKEDKTVIKYLETYFEKSNFQVIARSYQLAYRGALFDFDVKMEIELQQLQGQYLPQSIRYDGFWDIPGKKPEIARFSARFYEFY